MSSETNVQAELCAEEKFGPKTKGFIDILRKTGVDGDWVQFGFDSFCTLGDGAGSGAP